jgi:hypothetical protein
MLSEIPPIAEINLLASKDPKKKKVSVRTVFSLIYVLYLELLTFVSMLRWYAECALAVSCLIVIWRRTMGLSSCPHLCCAEPAQILTLLLIRLHNEQHLLFHRNILQFQWFGGIAACTEN